MPPPAIPYTRLRHGKLYLNLPIPGDLRAHFPTSTGKPRTHIVEALGTGDTTQARLAVREKAAYWELHFAKLRRGHSGELPTDIRKAQELRESVAQAKEEADQDLLHIVTGLAQDHAEQIEAKAGADAARQFYDLATSPERWTLREAVKHMHESPDMTEGTKKKRAQVLDELLRFLKVEDCLPSYITDAKAVAYVDWLNKQTLGYSTKQDRLSALQTIWRFMARRRQVPHNATPWVNHELTGRKKGAETSKRGWKDDELVRLLGAPDDARAKHYRRSLFRELYALGLITGMRLDEIVSIRPAAVEAMEEGGYWINVTESKTDAGVRGVPVVHPAAVAILKRRIEAQADKAESIFPECRPGGPDNKLSWHVQKAMGRDRDALGFGPEVDFHSTRRTFLTLMDNAGADVVHVQRYVGHRVPTMMHTVYSDGASRENLIKVARAARYPEKVEAVLASAA